MLRDMFKKTYTVIDSRVKTGKREKTEEPSICLLYTSDAADEL